MKKSYFAIAIIIVLILTIPKVQEWLEPIENKIILADISSKEEKSFKTTMLAHFRVIEENARKNSKVSLYKSGGDLQLYRIDKDNGGHPGHRYYVFDSSQNTVYDFSNIDVLIDSVKNGYLSNEEALLAYKYYEVNLNFFNRVFSDVAQEEKMKEYAKLFALSGDSEDYRILKRKDDIMKILSLRPKSGNMILDLALGDSTRILYDYSFIDAVSTNELLIWDLNNGITRYSFGFKGSDVKSVEPVFVGLIGNERTLQL